MMPLLQNILRELNHYKRPKDELDKIYIEDRLNSSLTAYYNELTSSIAYLEHKKDIKIMKKLNKEK